MVAYLSYQQKARIWMTKTLFFLLSDNLLAIGVAISTNASNLFGPYKDYGKPIIDQVPGAIDIHYFKDPM